nr:hypothetical protein [Mucilaginibacter sp. L294]
MKRTTNKQGLKASKTAFFFKSQRREMVGLCTDPINSTALTPTTGSLNCTV